MGKAEIKRRKEDSKEGERAQSNSWKTGSSKAESARVILKVSFYKIVSWDRAFKRANSTGQSNLPAAKEMQHWPKVMTEPEIQVDLHGQQETHTQHYAEDLISVHKVASMMLYPQ